MPEILEVDWDERKRRLVDLLEPVFVAYLYVLAVLQPVLGLILGIVALKKCRLEANKRVGKICVVVSVIILVVGALIAVTAVTIKLVSGGGRA